MTQRDTHQRGLARVTSKRGNGEGSIVRRSDGRWMARYCTTRDGLLVRRSLYAATRTEAVRKLRIALKERDDGMPAPPRSLRVETFLLQWLATASPSLKPSTARRYRDIIEGYLLPSLGRRRLGELAPQHVAAVYGGLLDRGLAPKTVQLTHTVLHRALSQAVRWEMLSRNAASLVDVPRVPCVEAPSFSPAQLARLRAVVRGDRLEALFVLAMLTGMRRGELLALRWDAVGLEARIVEVRGTLSRVDGGVTITEPKSRSSRRTIALGADAVDTLRAHSARQASERLRAGDAWLGDIPGYVFTTDFGQSMAPTSLIRVWRRLLETAGMSLRPFHALRHAATGLTVAANVAPKVAANRLGHATAAITLDRYSHVTDELERMAASAVEAVLREAGEGAQKQTG